MKETRKNGRSWQQVKKTIHSIHEFIWILIFRQVRISMRPLLCVKIHICYCKQAVAIFKFFQRLLLDKGILNQANLASKELSIFCCELCYSYK